MVIGCSSLPSGAMDSEVAQYLRQQNIPYFDMQAGMYSDMQGMSAARG